MKKILCLFISLCLLNVAVFATNFYSQGSSDPSVATNWNTLPGGGGSAAIATDFTTAGNTWYIQSAMTLGANWTLANNSNIEITPAGSLDAGTFTISLGGSWTNYGIFTRGTGTVVFTASAAQTLNGDMTGSNAFYNLTFNNAAGSWNCGANNVDVTNTLTQTAGALTAPSTTLKIGLNYVHTAGAFTHNSGTVEMNGTVAQALSNTSATTFNNLNISNTSAAVSAGAAITVNGTLTIASGAILNMTSRQLLGAFTPANSGTIQTQCTVNPAIPASNTWGGAVTYNGTTVAQIIPTGTYNDLNITGTTGTRTVTGSINVNGNFSVSTTTGVTTLQGALDVNGNVSLAVTAGNTSSILNPGSNNINVAGNWTVSSAGTSTGLLNTSAAFTTTFDGAGPQTISKTSGSALNANFYHFRNSNTTGSVTVVTSPSVTSTTMAGNVTIDVGATIVCAGANTMNVAGSWFNNGTFTSGTGTVNFNSGSAQTLNGTMTGSNKFYNLVFNSGTGSWDPGANDIEVANNLTLTAGAFTAPSTTLKIAGNYTHTAGSFTHNSGTVEMNGTVAQALSTTTATTFNNLNISNTAATVTAGAAIAVNGTLTVPSGANLNMSTFQLTGALTPVIGGTLQTQNVANPPIPTGMTWGGTVIYNGAGMFVSSGTYNTLSITGATGTRTTTGTITVNGNMSVTTTSGATTLGGDLDVNGNLSITGTTTTSIFKPGTNTVYVGGNYTLSSTTAAGLVDITTASTFVFDGTGAQTISKTSGSAIAGFYHLTNNNTANVLTLAASPSVTTTTLAGDFTNNAGATFTCAGANPVNVGGSWINNGSFNAGSSTVTMNAAVGTVTLSGNMTGANKFNILTFSGAGTKDFGANAADIAGALTISAGTVLAPSSTLKVAGNFVKAAGGTFTHNSGTVELNGTAVQTVPSTATSFNNLTISNTAANVNANAVTTINGNLTSAAGSNLNMVSFQLLGTINAAGHSGTLQTQCTVNPPIPTGTTWGGTVMYNGAAMFVSSATYNDLLITGTTGARTVTGTLAVNGNMSVTSTSGVTTLGGNLTVAGNIVLSSTTTANIFDVSINNYQIALGGNWSQSSSATTNPFNKRAGLVVINGAGTQTFTVAGGTSTLAFHHFQNSNTTNPFTLGAGITMSGNFTNDLNATTNCGANTVTITGNVANAGTLTTGANTMNIGGNWSNTGTFTSGTGTVNMNATSGTKTFTGNMTGGNQFNNLTFNGTAAWDFASNAADVAGNFTITTGTVTATSSTMKVGGNFSHAGGVFTHNSGIVEMNGAAAQTLPGATATTFNTLTLNNPAAAVSLNGTTTVLTDFTIPAANTLSAGSSALTLGGGYTNNGTFTAGTGSVTFNGAGAYTLNGSMTGSNKFNTLTFNNATGTWGFGANAADVGSNFTITTGAVTAPSTTLKVAGNFVHTAGTFNDNSGTVELNGTLAQAFPSAATTFNNLNVSNTTTTVSANANVTVNGTLTTAAAANLNMVTFQLLGTVTPAHSGTLQTQNTANPPIPTGKTWGGLVTYNAANNQTIAQGNYNNLTISGTTFSRTFTAGTTAVGGDFSLTTTTGVTTLAGDLNVGGSVAINGNATNSIFNPNSNNITVGGNWNVFTNSNTPTAFLNVTLPSTVTFNGTGTQIISKSGTGTAIKPNFYNFRNSNSTFPITLNYDLTFTGDVVNDAGATLDAGSSITSIAGNWTNNGTYTSGTGTVLFNSGATGKTISGNLTGTNKFNNVTFNNAAGTWSFSNAADIGGNFTITTSGAGGVTAPASTLKVAGNFVHTAGVFVPNGGTVEMNGAAAQTLPGATATTFSNLTLNNTSGNDVTLNGATTISNPFTIPVNNRLNGGTGITLTLNSDYTNNGTFTANTGTILFAATTAGRTINGDMTGTNKFNNLTFNGVSGAWTFGANAADVGGVLTLTNGAVTAPSTTLKVAGNFAKAAAATFIHNSGIVEMNGAAAQTIPGAATTFNTLALNNTANTITLNAATTALQNFSIPVSNTLACGAQTLTLGAGYSNNGTFTAGAGTVLFNSSAAGNTLSGTMTGSSKFNNLTFNNASGAWTFDVAPADVGTAFTITAGAVTAPSTTLKVAGNFVHTAGTFNDNGGTVELNGGGAQAFPTTATTFNHLTVSNTAATVTANAAVTINGNLTTAAASNLNMVTFQMLGTVNGSANAGILQTQCAVNPPIPLAGTWGGEVRYNSTTTSLTVAQGTYNNLTITGTSGLRTFTSGTTTVNGNCSIGSATTTTGVTSLGGPLVVAGNLTIGSTTTAGIFNVTASNYQVNVGGNWTQFSSAATNPFNKQTGTVVFNGTGAQTVSTSAGTSRPSFNNLTVSNTVAPVAFSTNTDVAATLSVAASATVSPTTEGVQFNTGAAAGTITGSGTILVNRISATADYSNQYKFTTNTLGSLTVNYTGAGAQYVNAFTYGTLIASNSGTKTAQGNITVNNALDVNSGITLDMGVANRLIAGTAPTYTVSGTLKTSVPTATSAAPLPSGAVWNGAGTVEYAVLSGAQTIVGGTYNNLLLDNTSGTNNASGDITIVGTLTLGKMALAANNLILGNAATISGVTSSNYIVATGAGVVRKGYTADATFIYPVGDATNYTPLSLNVTGGGYSTAYAQVNVTASKHPSNVNSTNYLNRYWTVGTSGISAQSYTATATYVPADISGTESSISGASYSGTLPWVLYGAAGSNTLVANSISTANTAISGLSNVPGTVSVSPGSSTICNGGTQALTATPTGDAPFTYTWSPSTGLSATTGVSVNATLVNTTTTVATTIYTVTMTDGNGLTATSTATVNVDPQEPVSGTLSVCEGFNTTLTPATAGGVWSSTTPAIGTIDASTGVFHGIDQGTAAVTYTLPSGCFSAVTVTVNNQPAANTGTAVVCKNATTTLANADGGGSWTSSTPAVATVGAASGIVSGVDAGTATITYTLTGGCFVTTEVTVNALPVITGIAAICTSTSSTLSATPIGGLWSSSNATIASVGTASGIVSGIAAGNANISYTDLNTCTNFVQVTVSAALVNITGVTGICEGLTTTMSHVVAGGTWVSSNTSRATIDLNTGLLTAISAGPVVITYSVGTGCSKTKNVDIQLQPAPITGTLNMCDGSYTVLYSTIGGSGTWSSSNTGVATADLNSGYITSVSQGTATITYKIPTSGCQEVAVVTVNPVPAAITGSSTICQGATEAYSSSPAGGTWVSSNTSAATINSTSGNATGISAGVSLVSYTLGTGCRVTKSVTVNNLAAGIDGNLLLCLAGTSTLSSATAGGVWTSSLPGVATISAGGDVTPTGIGNTTISYILPTGCIRTAVVTVNAAPAANTGIAQLCIAATTTLSNATAGGTWTSSNTSNATVAAATGVVTGIATGTSNITYTVSGAGCYIVTEVTVDPAPATITGTANACVGFTSTLAHSSSGGTWSSSNASIASVNATTGVVTAVAAGNVNITYMVSGTCFATTIFTSKALPATITGTQYACVGTTTNLFDITAEGTWSSSNTAKAIIHPTSGIVTGVATGTTVISYILPTGCYTTAEVTVNAAPAVITGPASVCFGSNTTLNCTPASGTWSSSNTSVATIDISTGEVSGITPGTTTISCTHAVTGCRSVRTFTVGGTPAAISGNLTLCVTSTSTLTDASTGGTWTSSNAAVATVGTASGIVTATGAGNATITYNQSGGCIATAVVTVSTSIAGITGDNNLCIAGNTSLANVTVGGTWSSSATAKATVGLATGIVTGVSAGTAIVTYKVTASCYSTSVVTVAPSPAAITGSAYVCLGSSIILSHATAGGVWSSSNPAAGTVNGATGEVTGIAAGTTTVTYTVSNGCFVTKLINATTPPPAISGTMNICEASSSALTCIIGGSATWSSSNTSVATIGSTSGLMTGVGGGTTTITYRVNTTGCYSVREATVNALPDVITGSNSICAGSTQTYSSATGGGTWTSSNTSVAAIGSATGIATGGTGGTTNISYTVSTGCRRTKSVTVNNLPATIAGVTTYCAGGTSTLTSATAGGTWSSDNVAATISAGGLVSATAPGNSTISYTMSTGCARTATVTVNAALDANTGNNSICVGGATTLANSLAGGTWSSSVTARATVGVSTGVVTGVATGTSNISYIRSGAGCYSITQVTVNAALAAITGTTNVCVGDLTTLSHVTPGGTWSSSNTGLATVDNTTGEVTGVGAGAPIITYTASPGCIKTAVVTVKALPNTITGSTTVCAGSNVTLSTTSTGGTWSSSNTGVALINTLTGIVVGQSAGTTNITYKGSNLCIRTTVATVNQLPAAITGTLSAAISGTRTLASATPGGAWTSSNATVATVGVADGIVAALTTGTSVISYTLPTGCYKTATFSVTVSRPGGYVYFSSADNKIIFSVFPNPTTGTFTIEAPAKGVFSIFAVDGKSVAEYEINAASTTVTLPSDLAAGVYMCRFNQEDGETTIVRLWYQP